MSSLCFIKALLKYSPCLLAPCSPESLTEQRTEAERSGVSSPHFFFPFLKSFLFPAFLAPAAMEIAARFIALAHRDLPFTEYSREFCGLAAATALDDATILSLFWHGANAHRPVDLPDTTGLKWREGILRCLESVRARARTSLPSSAVPQAPTRPRLFLACRQRIWQAQ